MIKRWKTIKWLMIIMFIAMVFVNGLANILPINGITTGEVSDAYPNLFAPIGWTFSIWGLIYLLLAVYVVMTYFDGYHDHDLPSRDRHIAYWFLVSCAANTVWVILWHYEQLLATLSLMIVLLISLSMIAELLRKEPSKGLNRIKLALPFHIYFGWITVATIANITTYLVSINWQMMGLGENVWAIIIIIVGALIGSLMMWRYHSLSYGLVVLWAYIGIYFKHTSQTGFASIHSDVIFAITASIILVVVALVVVARNKIMTFKNASK